MHKLLLILYLGIAIVMQTVTGNFPLHFFAFPLNLICALLWLFLLERFYRESGTSSFIRLLLSSRMTVVSILLFIGGTLIIGLFPQLSDAEAASMGGIAGALGCYNFMTSWIFIAILLLLLTQLGVVILHAISHRTRARKCFLLNHAGLWMALFAGFFGSSDVQTLRIPLYAGSPAREAYDMEGKAYYLDYELELHKFEAEYYPNGMPSRLVANIRAGKEEALLEVNHPYSYRSGEDIYLVGYDSQNPSATSYCVLQIVRQPWKYIMVAGILMMLVGSVLLFINGPKHLKYDNVE